MTGNGASAKLPQHLALLLFVTILVIAIRIAAPSDLATGDQPYQVDYIRDVALRGNWIAQHLQDGTPAAKPPLYNWLAAPLVMLTGSEHPLLLKLPSLLAGIALVLLTWDFTRRLAGAQAAFAAALLLVTTTMYVKLVYFARTDMLLCALIALQMHAAVRQRPFVYWTAAALSLLTKGPVGVLLPLATLIAWWASRRELRERWRAMHMAVGLLTALVPFAVWFLAAIAVEGQPLWNQLVYAETIDRFRAGSSKAKEHRHVLYYIPHFLSRLAPASLIAAVALAKRDWRKRDNTISLAAFWVLVMLAVLSLVPSKRADRLFPILPAACALAGWLIATQPRTTRVVMQALAVVLCAGGLYAGLGWMGSGVVQAAGGVLVLLAVVMFVKPRYALAALVPALLVINATYQFFL